MFIGPESKIQAPNLYRSKIRLQHMALSVGRALQLVKIEKNHLLKLLVVVVLAESEVVCDRNISKIILLINYK